MKYRDDDDTFVIEEPTRQIKFETSAQIALRHRLGDIRDALPATRDTQEIAVPRVETRRMGSRGGQPRVVIR